MDVSIFFIFSVPGHGKGGGVRGGGRRGGPVLIKIERGGGVFEEEAREWEGRRGNASGERGGGLNTFFGAETPTKFRCLAGLEDRDRGGQNAPKMLEGGGELAPKVAPRRLGLLTPKLAIFYRISVESGPFRGSLDIQNCHPPSNWALWTIVRVFTLSAFSSLL